MTMRLVSEMRKYKQKIFHTRSKVAFEFATLATRRRPRMLQSSTADIAEGQQSCNCEAKAWFQPAWESSCEHDQTACCEDAIFLAMDPVRNLSEQRRAKMLRYLAMCIPHGQGTRLAASPRCRRMILLLSSVTY